jgi:hypothetical protein
MEDIFENALLKTGACMARGAFNYFLIILISIINPKPKTKICKERIYELDADGKILI